MTIDPTDVRALRRHLLAGSWHEPARGIQYAYRCLPLPFIKDGLRFDVDPIGRPTAEALLGAGWVLVADATELYHARPTRPLSEAVERPRSEWWSLRCTPEQRARWEQAATAMGLTPGEYAAVALDLLAKQDAAMIECAP